MALDSINHVLKKTFGFDHFRGPQQAVIESILEGKDTLALMPTGAGKSLCYQLPALLLPGLCLVVSPLISLMNDQIRHLHALGIEAVSLNSGQSDEEKMAARESLRAGLAKFLFISPEMLFASAGMYENMDLSLLVIDEAHCISQWGHDFRPEYAKIGDFKSRLQQHTPLLALTATADEKTRVDIVESLRFRPNFNIFISSFDRPNITYAIFEKEREREQLWAFLQLHKKETGIIYCQTRKRTEDLTAWLIEKKRHAYCYHAGLQNDVKIKTQQAFSQDDHPLVVATLAFGMGINRPDVRFVIHLDMPKSLENYYQETGRAGRDGLPAQAIMYYGHQDIMQQKRFIEQSEADVFFKNLQRSKLETMIQLAETETCRREMILHYFSEKDVSGHCQACDNCLNPPREKIVSTTEAQMLLSAIYKTGEGFGASHLIDILRGSQNAKVKERGHDKISVFGIGKHRDRLFWQALVRKLLGLNALQILNWELGVLSFGPRSGDILKGQIPISLSRKQLEAKSMAAQIESKEASRPEFQGGQGELFSTLKDLRRKLAEAEKVPAYLIFNDKTLVDMTYLKPRNLSEFLLVHGVGEKKRDLYGTVFLDVIKRFAN
jgi:ATP-dependent DNA helicase RecQ